jgi:hypothetical protein
MNAYVLYPIQSDQLCGKSSHLFSVHIRFTARLETSYPGVSLCDVLYLRQVSCEKIAFIHKHYFEKIE